MNEIQDGLWISDIDTVMHSPTDRFDVVVSVCQDCPRDNIRDDITVHHHSLADDPQSEKQYGGAFEYGVFVEAVKSVTAALQDDAVTDVLCHCHVGQNRSASVCAAAIAIVDDIRYEDALSRVTDVRPIANPTESMQRFGEQAVYDVA